MRQAFGTTFLLITSLAGLSCSSQKAAEVRVYQMGDRVQVGPLIYHVTEADWHDQIGEGADARTAEHRFLVVRLSVTNSGVRESDIPAMSLVGADNQNHPEHQEGKGVPEWFGHLRTVKPASTEHGRILFDVMPGIYKLRVAEEADDPDQQRAALIEIPFQVRPAKPELPQAVPQPDNP